jgi:hypothetical protein
MGLFSSFAEAIVIVHIYLSRLSEYVGNLLKAFQQTKREVIDASSNTIISSRMILLAL